MTAPQDRPPKCRKTDSSSSKQQPIGQKTPKKVVPSKTNAVRGICHQFKNRDELLQGSHYLGIQETPPSYRHDFELRECQLCGSSFVARKIPKLPPAKKV